MERALSRSRLLVALVAMFARVLVLSFGVVIACQVPQNRPLMYCLRSAGRALVQEERESEKCVWGGGLFSPVHVSVEVHPL